MDNTVITTAQDESILFLGGILDETVALLVEARDYFSNNHYGSRDNIKEDSRLVYSREMSRITIRLSSIIAWLMAQKAVACGQLSRQEVMDEHKLTNRDICLNRSVGVESVLPPTMTNLLDASFNLYSRVNRLDQQMNGDSGVAV